MKQYGSQFENYNFTDKFGICSECKSLEKDFYFQMQLCNKCDTFFKFMH